MINKNNILILIGIFLLCFGSKALAQTPHDFVGVKKCSLCHKKDDGGNQYGKWMESKHSKAFETLGTDAAKKTAKERGIDDPQTSGQCLKCHSTAYHFTESIVTDAIPVEEGISCESCHGAGKDYMKKSIMENRDDAIANGLVIPDEKACVQCHNPESPQYQEFHFSEFWEKIKHPLPEK